MNELKGLPLVTSFTDRGGIQTVTDVDKIHSNVVAILLTKKGERFRKPSFGCDLKLYVMQPNDSFIEENIKQSIVDALAIWETRVVVEGISIARLEKTIDITVQYKITTLDTSEVITLSIEQGDYI